METKTPSPKPAPLPTPTTLMDAMRFFADPDVCLDYLIPLVFPKGVVCRWCGAAEPMFLKTRRIWKCRACRKQFSIKTGTIMEDSPLPLDKWLLATWLIASAKNGISSYELHRAIGVTQKSAWFMLHRIRLAMQNGSLVKLGGAGTVVEVDETYIGGKARNMHKGRRKQGGTGMVGKAIVQGVLERGGEFRGVVVKDAKGETLRPNVHKHVERESYVFTDALQSYTPLAQDFIHKVIDHAEAYVKGNVHTNGLENFWSLFKRCVKGTYVAVEPFHLFRYVDEEAFRFNSRKATDGQRFVKALGSISGKRLRYKALIGDGAPCSSSQDNAAASAV